MKAIDRRITVQPKMLVMLLGVNCPRGPKVHQQRYKLKQVDLKYRKAHATLNFGPRNIPFGSMAILMHVKFNQN